MSQSAQDWLAALAPLAVVVVIVLPVAMRAWRRL